jgi:hypothetical protein
MPSVKTSNKTDRLRPDVILGGMLDALSLPRHEPKSEAQAEQKHQERDVTTHVTMDALYCSSKDRSEQSYGGL